ncbi:MAG: FlgO family outer membrane protein [Campylobacterota bacterium]|nr:FlgO family outer membrane protein [Campylobacterota bacterium]
MKKTLSMFLLSLLIVVGFSGCGEKNRAYKTWQTNPQVDDTINETIIRLSDQLLSTSRISSGEKIAITSFVDLHQLNKTTHFGRKLSESFFKELHVRGFSLVDARGTETIRINADGEFFITRDIKLLNKKVIENSYVLVGTYTRFGDGVMVNARIMDNISGDIVSVARTIIHVSDCDLYENCIKPASQKPLVSIPNRTIGISDAGCSYVTCPENCVDSACYNYEKRPIIQYTKVKHTPKKVCHNCEIGAK